MDFGRKFSLGHPWDAEKDFGHGTGYFSCFAKTGYGDGHTATNMKDNEQ